MRGASEHEPGVENICPQGVPLYHFANNEAHNNGKYGLRIFSGISPHTGKGLPGFQPKAVDSCGAVSADNPYALAQFKGQFSWRNTENGISLGAVAAVQIRDALLVDNCMRGIEFISASAVSEEPEGDTKILGPWGTTGVFNSIIIGHQWSCPACDRSLLPIMPDPVLSDDTTFGMRPLSLGTRHQVWGRPMRIGISLPPWSFMSVHGVTFVNYDRDCMLALGGSTGVIPPCRSCYNDFGKGGYEVQLKNMSFVESDKRAYFRWFDEMLLHDLDGTFTEGPAGQHVVHTPLVWNSDVFPDCYFDVRYGGSVCKPSMNFVRVGMSPPDNLMKVTMSKSQSKMVYRPGGMWVLADDHVYLQDKWRPAGSFNLVQMAVDTDELHPMPIGDADTDYFINWDASSCYWLDAKKRVMRLTFKFTSRWDGAYVSKTTDAVISADGSNLTFVDAANASQIEPQLEMHVVWYRCAVLPHKCVGKGIQYADEFTHGKSLLDRLPTDTTSSINSGKGFEVTGGIEISHAFGLSLQGGGFDASSFRYFLPTNRRFQFVMSVSMHLESSFYQTEFANFAFSGIHIGQGLAQGEWLEIESTTVEAYPKHPFGFRPLHALPVRAELTFDNETSTSEWGGGSTYFADRGMTGNYWPPSPPPQPSNGGRRLTVPSHRRELTASSVTVNRTQGNIVMHFEGKPKCFSDRPYDPCFAAIGEVSYIYAPPPSPPPPSPPKPPPPPPPSPPSPLPPHAPLAFAALMDVGVNYASLGNLTATAMTAAVSNQSLYLASAEQRDSAIVQAETLVRGSVTLSLTGNVGSSVYQEQVRMLAEARICRGLPPASCSITITSSGRRLGELSGGTLQFTVTRSITPLTSTGSIFPSACLSAAAPVASCASTFLESIGNDALAAIPSCSGCSLSSAPVSEVAISARLTGLGKALPSVSSASNALKAAVATDLSLSASAVTAQEVDLIQPPSPPPSTPPQPNNPPMPPLAPPTSPALPPTPEGISVPYTEGCDPDCVGGCARYLWSNMWTWHGQGKALGARDNDALFTWPSFKSNVTIQRCRTVELDVNLNVQLFSIVVWGTLVIRDRGPSTHVRLRAICITVKPGGKIIAGSPTVPFSGSLEFLLYGDEMTTAPQCEDKGLGKRINVGKGNHPSPTRHGGEGTLELYGAHPNVMHSKLRNTVSAGATEIIVIGMVDWKINDQIAIATTDLHGREGETRTITGVSYTPNGGLTSGGFDTRITLSAALSCEHIAITETHGSQVFDMRAEVGLLYRPVPTPDGSHAPSIRISGADSTAYNFRFRTAAYTNFGQQTKIFPGATAILRGVSIEKSGGINQLLAGIKCAGACDVRSSIIRTQWLETSPGALGIVHTGGGVGHYEDLVFYRNWVSMTLRGRALVRNTATFEHMPVQAFKAVNYLFETHEPNTSPAIAVMDYGFGITMVNNSVAVGSGPSSSNYGQQGACYAHVVDVEENGVPVKGGKANVNVFSGSHTNGAAINSCHSAYYGVLFKGANIVGEANWMAYPTDPTLSYTDLVIWNVNVYAITGYTESDDWTISRVAIINAKAGLWWATAGSEFDSGNLTIPTKRQRLVIRDSTFVGRSSVASPIQGLIVGIYLPYHGGGGLGPAPLACAPTVGGPPMEGFYGPTRHMGSNPSLGSQTRIEGVTFVRYFDKLMGRATVLHTHHASERTPKPIPGAMQSADAVAPLYFSGISIDADSRANLAHLPAPHRDWSTRPRPSNRCHCLPAALSGLWFALACRSPRAQVYRDGL